MRMEQKIGMFMFAFSVTVCVSTYIFLLGAAGVAILVGSTLAGLLVAAFA